MIVGMSALHRSSFLSLGKCFYSTLKMELHPQTLTFFSLLSSFWQTLNISTANDSSFTVLYNIRVFIFQDVCTELHLVQDYNSHSSHPFFNGLSQIDFTHTVPTVLLTQYRQFYSHSTDSSAEALGISRAAFLQHSKSRDIPGISEFSQWTEHCG